MGRFRVQAEQVTRGRRHVHQADGDVAAVASRDGAGRGNDEGNSNVLLVQKERMAHIAWVLAECLAVVAVHDKKRLVEQPTGRQAVNQRADGHIPFVQRTLVAMEIGRGPERTGAREHIRVMSGNRHVGQHESLARGKGVNPREHPSDGGRFIHTET